MYEGKKKYYLNSITTHTFSVTLVCKVCKQLNMVLTGLWEIRTCPYEMQEYGENKSQRKQPTREVVATGGGNPREDPDVILCQETKLDHSIHNSELFPNIHGGVPRGSVLGPVLFIRYINDMPDIVSSIIYMYADVTKICREMSDTSDSGKLQVDLNNIQKWSEEWQLKFNITKCKVMHLGNANDQS